MAQNETDGFGTVKRRPPRGARQEDASERRNGPQQSKQEDSVAMDDLFHLNPLVFTGKGMWILFAILAGTKILTGLLAGGIVLKLSSMFKTL